MKYGNTVVVTSEGFYKGAKGKLVGTDEFGGYYVQLKGGQLKLFYSHNLKLVKAIGGRRVQKK